MHLSLTGVGSLLYNIVMRNPTCSLLSLIREKEVEMQYVQNKVTKYQGTKLGSTV